MDGGAARPATFRDMRLPYERQIWIIAAVVSLSLLAVVAWQTNLADVGRLLAKIRGTELLAALAVSAAINFVCSVRLVNSFGALDRGRFLAAADINFIHSLLLALLPARLGDAYYPLLLARLDIRVGRALTNLLLLRLFDATVLGTTFILSGLTIVALPGLGWQAALSLVAVLLLAAFFSVALLPSLCRWIATTAFRFRHPVMRRVARHALDGRRWLDGLSLTRRLELFALTIVYWVASGLVVWLVLAAFGIELRVAQAAFVSSGLSLAGALPLQTIAGFGAAEASLTLLLVIVGFSAAEAASIGIVARLCLLALPIVGAALWLPPRWTAARWRAVAR